MEITKAQIEEWVKKYGKGNVIQLSAEDATCFIFNPITNLPIMKLAITARRQNAGAMVDAILNNCFIGGDESCKTDDSFKLGIEDQMEKMIDIPEAKVIRNGSKSTISINGYDVDVRLATRQDIRYAEDRNKDNVALNTSIYLLEKTSLSKEQLKKVREDNKSYLSVLLAVNELKDKKYVEIKNF